MFGLIIVPETVPGNLTEVADQFHSVALQDTLGETSFDSANGGESVLVENEEEAPNKEQSLPESGHTDCPVDQMEVLNSYQQNSFGRESFGAAFDQENFEDADFDYDGDSTMFKDAEEPLPNENNCVTQPIKNPEKINLTGIKINLGRGGNRGPNPISQGDGLRVNVGRVGVSFLINYSVPVKESHNERHDDRKMCLQSTFCFPIQAQSVLRAVPRV